MTRTAITLSEKSLKSAQRLAKKLGISRSELFRNAISEYVARHSRDVSDAEITRSVNEVYGPGGIDSSVPDDLMEMQVRSLGKEIW